mmetsp:Transcript_28630/g.48893  ORF Transcript_28630/g.48893 Transcript_28630/m.48893 type:complete len:338 (+) Transcript_28630:264-1277(+)
MLCRTEWSREGKTAQPRKPAVGTCTWCPARARCGSLLRLHLRSPRGAVAEARCPALGESSALGVRELGAHGVDGLLVVGRVEDGAARDEHVDARLRNLLDVLHAHAAVDLEGDVVARLVDELARLLRLRQRGGDEGLAAEARVDRHEQDDVHLVHDVLEAVERGGRVEDEPRLAARRAHELQRAVDVRGGLRVEGDVVSARVRKVADDPVDRRNHQVDINRLLDAVVLKRLANQWADGQVGHEMVVHDIEVNYIGASRHHVLNLLTKTGKVGGQNRGRDLVVHHARLRGAADRGGGAGTEAKIEGGDRRKSSKQRKRVDHDGILLSEILSSENLPWN